MKLEGSCIKKQKKTAARSIAMNLYLLLSLCFLSNIIFHPTLAKKDDQSQNMANLRLKYRLRLNQGRMNQLKMSVRNEFIRTISICYDRFQRCSKQLSPTFCASTTKNITFYIWARKVADSIMEGDWDNYGNAKCIPAQIKAMANVLNISGLEKQPQSSLWANIGKILNIAL